MKDDISQENESPAPQIHHRKQTMAETAAFPFQFSITGRNIAQFGISFRHLAAIHAMQGFVASLTEDDYNKDFGDPENVASFSVELADALAAELDRTEGRGNDASEDSALLDHFEKHFCQPCQVNGGPDDGREGKAWVLASHGNWTLREAIRVHKAGVDAGEIQAGGDE